MAEKKKKRFNIVDIIIILLVIAVVGAIAVKLLGDRATEVVSQKSDCWMEVEIIGAGPNLVDEVERQDLVGERLVSGNEYMNATVEKVWTEEYWVQAIRDDGVVVDAMDPTKVVLCFLIKTQVAPDTPSPKIGSQEMRAGKTFIVKTQRFECAGTIRYVEIGEYTKNAGPVDD